MNTGAASQTKRSHLLLSKYLHLTQQPQHSTSSNLSKSHATSFFSPPIPSPSSTHRQPPSLPQTTSALLHNENFLANLEQKIDELDQRAAEGSWTRDDSTATGVQ